MDVAGAVGRFDKREFLSLHSDGAVVMDAGLVCGREHLVSAVEHARRAFERGTNTARSLELEVLLYAAGERQLSAAIDLMEVRSNEVALVVLEGEIDALITDLGLIRDDSVIDVKVEKVLRLGIPKQMLDTVGEGFAQDLVLEKVALVDLEKRSSSINGENQA